MAAPTLTGLEALAQAARAGVERGVAPVERWDPDHCGEIDIRIAADGTWFHEGAVISRPALVRLFSTVLRRDPDGFHLVTPGEKLKIVVDDAPFVAVAVDQPADGVLRFATNVGDMIEAGPDHPIRIAPAGDGERSPRPYIHVRGGLEALLARPVFYELAGLVEPRPGDGALCVRSHGAWFRLEPASEPGGEAAG
jgi:hypothetical protein